MVCFQICCPCSARRNGNLQWPKRCLVAFKFLILSYRQCKRYTVNGGLINQTRHPTICSCSSFPARFFSSWICLHDARCLAKQLLMIEDLAVRASVDRVSHVFLLGAMVLKPECMRLRVFPESCKNLFTVMYRENATGKSVGWSVHCDMVANHQANRSRGERNNRP